MIANYFLSLNSSPPLLRRLATNVNMRLYCIQTSLAGTQFKYLRIEIIKDKTYVLLLRKLDHTHADGHIHDSVLGARTEVPRIPRHLNCPERSCTERTLVSNRTPVVIGIELLAPSTDDFGAAFATVCSASMFHIVGVTPSQPISRP